MNADPGFTNLLALMIASAVQAGVAYALAKDKGRSVVAWTLLALLPVLNFFLMFYFVGAANLRLERKLDEVLRRTEALNR